MTKLPLDHFRLLGVKPGVNSSEIERTLVERLRNPPSEGYSLESLDARAEILRSSGAFLMDEQRCRSHGRQLATIPGEDGPDEGRFSGIELEPGQEMVAPLLLLEAQDNLQAFELALELLSRRGETAAFRGHQQADLLLMAALAARRASQQMWTKRLYDQSAQILERVIQVMAQHPSQARRKAILEDDLYKVVPFQVLDLLSQESCTPAERQRGLRSLKALIDHRGGLDAEDDEQCSPIVFRDFFKQIRPRLTIDEQLGLFEGYSVQGASTATFLLAYTRAAAGFQRRQPAHVDAALAALEAVDVEGLEPEKACLLLLLGQPDAAQDMVKSCQDPRLCQWLASYPSTSDSLPGLCSFCSQWLERHVLPCYRDVDPRGKVDLDAYFLDPQVQGYIKDRDSLPAPRPGPPESKSSGVNGEEKAKQMKDLALFTPANPVKQAPQAEQTGQQEPLSLPPPHRWPDVGGASTARPAAKSNEAMDSAPVAPQGRTLWPLMAKTAMVAGVTMALLVLRPWSLLTTTARTPVSPPPQPPSPPPDAAALNNPPPALPSLANTPTPLDLPRIQAVQDAEALDLAGVTTLLRSWLHVKASVLDTSPATRPSPDILDALALLAVPDQVTAVLNQHRSLRERGEQLNVKTTLGDVALLAQTPSQVSARVVLTYAESTRDAGGATTNTLGPTILRNDYTFVREQQGWRLLRFSPSPPLGIASR
ncbi:MAG: DUF4101 domain-containing protein [Synechococcus sp. SB0666_bin_14]|nr:DUF4101 domain-containing protein [Synechococcus sp. SB0666_bin_14]MYG47714.1 DUF4101 domain-containing protein [Synechococcus sp. SB0675_bin_6]MYJ59674.1 DUF4101 domain-containing protein [Synechococcus sp. SB0672_bin_6]MYK91606.1 DUF4101 domain-containing protein [Synechococcus sp. SB0669_bin_8]